MNKSIQLSHIMIAIMLLAMTALVGCAGVESGTSTSDVRTSDSDEMLVATTIFPLYSIAQEVAGDHVDVQLILEPGTSPHTFDPSPSVLRDIQGAQRIFAIGEGVDTWVEGIAENTPTATVVTFEDDVITREFADEEHDDEHDEDEHEDHAHEGTDPHYWLSPENAVIIAEQIARELAAIDPAHAEDYMQNATTFGEEITQQDVLWKEQIAALTDEQRKFVTFHSAFGYFAEYFDLNIVTTFEPFPGQEPTPVYLQGLQEEIEEQGVNVVFAEPQFDTSSLEQFAKDNNLTIDVLDPLGGVDGRMSYIDLINSNVNTIVSVLQ